MDLEQSNVLYRYPAWYEQLRFDPNHVTAKQCEELIDLHGPPGARTILDFGCGTGQDLTYLAKRFAVVGVDLRVYHLCRTLPSWNGAHLGDCCNSDRLSDNWSNFGWSSTGNVPG